MFNLKLCFFSVAVALGIFSLPSSVVFAGASGSGGADTIQCGSIPKVNFGGSGAILADIVNSKSMYDTKYFQSLTLGQARTGVLSFIKKYRPADYDTVSMALSKVTPFQFTDTELPNLQTGAKPKFIHRLFGCNKEQLAIQELATGEVLVFEPLYDQLSVIEKALLEVHEAFIYIASKNSNDLLEMETFARNKVSDYFNDINFREVPPEILPGSNAYLGTETARKIVSTVTNSDCWSCSFIELGGNGQSVRTLLERAGFGSCPRSLTWLTKHEVKKDITLYEYVMKIQGIRIQDCR